MTIIDTTLYLDGQLRLSRHGAGRGGNVLVHEASNRQVSIADDTLPRRIDTIRKMIDLGWRSGPIFDMVEFYERVES